MYVCMYVCMYICTDVFNICMHVSMNVCGVLILSGKCRLSLSAVCVCVRACGWEFAT
jgi:hypothetical protein